MVVLEAQRMSRQIDAIAAVDEIVNQAPGAAPVVSAAAREIAAHLADTVRAGAWPSPEPTLRDTSPRS